jgi:hypothetical protein
MRLPLASLLKPVRSRRIRAHDRIAALNGGVAKKCAVD